ncbi:MAG: cation diffusion facilitator family transporter [Burkholderiaceae bacterium]
MAESRVVVYGAMAGNTAIAVTKFIVAGITGSSSMLSEAIHSTVDTGNNVLLLVGMKRSKRKGDADHPFGYGREIYFWSLIVGVLIFGLGGGMSIYEGIQHIRHPEPMTDPKWNYIVLAAATVFEGTSFGIAVHAVFKTKGKKPFWKALHDSKDPSIFTVVAEDGAALAGLALAAIGIFASHYFKMPVLDGTASIAIGLLLVAVAVVLIWESRGLLIGEGMDQDTARAVRDMVEQDAAVIKSGLPLTMYLGPEEVLMTLDVEFENDMPAEQVFESVHRIESAIRTRFKRVKRIYIESNPEAVQAQTERLGSST